MHPRTSRPLAPLSVAAALTASIAAALPQQDAILVMREGDTLSNGWRVEGFEVPAIAADGKWGAIVRADVPGSSASARAIVVDGGLFGWEGQLLPNGERVEFILDADIDTDGTVVAAYTVRDPSSSAPAARVQVGQQILLRSGDAVTSAMLPTPACIFTVRDVETALPYVWVRADLDPVAPGLPLFRALLRYQVGTTGPPAIIAYEGQQLPGALGPVEQLSGVAAIASDGTYLTTIDQDTPGSVGITAFRNGVAVYQDGLASPIGGTTWQHDVNPSVAKAPGNSFVIASRIRESGGNLRGIVLSNNTILASQGSPIFGGGGPIAGAFSTVAVAQAHNGLTLYKAPTNTGSVLMAFDELLLQSNVSRAGGLRIISTKPTRRESLDVTADGNLVLAEVSLTGDVDALVLVERRVGHTLACPANPNSTGNVGRLEAYGSSVVQVNMLRIEAFDLPQGSFGYLNTSRTPTFVPNAGGSSGNLCLGGTVGRFRAQTQSTGTTGAITTLVNLNNIPQPNGTTAILAGQRWGFQLWHRDTSQTGPPTSNFTEALIIDFQ